MEKKKMLTINLLDYNKDHAIAIQNGYVGQLLLQSVTIPLKSKSEYKQPTN